MSGAMYREHAFCSQCGTTKPVSRNQVGHYLQCDLGHAIDDKSALARTRDRVLSPTVGTPPTKKQFKRVVIEEVENGWMLRITDTQDRVIAKYVYQTHQGEEMMAFARLSILLTDDQIIKATGVHASAK